MGYGLTSPLLASWQPRTRSICWSWHDKVRKLQCPGSHPLRCNTEWEEPASSARETRGEGGIPSGPGDQMLPPSPLQPRAPSWRALNDCHKFNTLVQRGDVDKRTRSRYHGGHVLKKRRGLRRQNAQQKGKVGSAWVWLTALLPSPGILDLLGRSKSFVGIFFPKENGSC